MPRAKLPSPWRGAQLDLLAIEAETDRIWSLGLDPLAQTVPRDLGRGRLIKRE